MPLETNEVVKTLVDHVKIAASVNSLEHLQQLYDRNKFLEAFRRSAGYWKPSTNVGQLTTDELILGGRLAARLGGHRLCRWLFREALNRKPSQPRVVYYSRNIRRRNTSLLDDLWAFQAQPDIGGDDLEVRAAWQASYAVTWASLRDFARAHECLQRAHSLHPNDSWVLCCESDVLGLADRWKEALKSAELAWESSPESPFAGRALGNCLLNLGRVEESARQLAAAAENCESYELMHVTCWHQCAWIETLDGEERRSALDRARALAEELPTLAPLADRESRSLIARTNLDIARLAGDPQALEYWAHQVRSPYFRQVWKNLRSNGNGICIRLPFRRAIQKHQACLPTSLSSALATMGVQIDADEMASDITFGGTLGWAAGEWLEKRGLVIRFFAVTPEVAASLIKNGIAFVLSLDGDDSAHAVAVVGLDEAAGTLLVHDPQSFRTFEYLLKFIGRGEAPLGPRGMAAVPPERAQLLDRLLHEADVEVMTASHAYQKALGLQGPTAAREVVAAVVKRQPSHPGTRLLQAIAAADNGRAGESLLGCQELLKSFPNSKFLRARLLWACRAVGNTALLRETLTQFVETGILPGVESQQDWQFPPAAYVCDYADLLRQSAATHSQAHSLLRSVIRHEPGCAKAWHSLADLLWEDHDTERALLCYRLASCLAEHDEHHALAYSGVLSRLGREEEGFSWLENRVCRFGDSPRAVRTWVSWISELENQGHPERALNACTQALIQHGDSPELLAFVVPFLARMGRWEEAEKHLQALERASNHPLFYEAATSFYRMRGELKRAITEAEAWVEEMPLSIRARQELLNLIERRDGFVKAADQAAQWVSENPGHDELERLYFRLLQITSSPKRKEYSLLLRRLRRNPQDGWAWSQLAHCCLNDYGCANEERCEKLGRRILRFLAQCDHTAPAHPATIRAHALWHEVRGERSQASALWIEAIKRQPEDIESYEHLAECSASIEPEQRKKAFDEVQRFLLDSPTSLSVTPNVLKLLGLLFGLTAAQEAAHNWKRKRPRDPEVIRATADLLLDDGHGRTDAIEAAAILEPAIKQYPYHPGLRFSMAMACRKLGRIKEAEEILLELALRHPGDTMVQVQLAWIYDRAGNKDEALRCLATAINSNPWNGTLLTQRVQLLIACGELRGSISTIHDGLRQLPTDVSWRDSAVTLLLQYGHASDAVEAARDGVRQYPNGARLWLLLGTTLKQAPQFSRHGEIETCFRRAVQLNQTFFEASDALAVLLTEQRRYDEAEQLMRRILVRMGNPSPALGRLAWVHRQQGRRQQAVEELALCCSKAPCYDWGWNVLLSWLVEDRACWPADKAWHVAVEKQFEEDAYRAARSALQSGARPTPAALSLMAAYAFKRSGYNPSAFWCHWFRDTGAREILAMLQVVESATWPRDEYRAELLRYLVDYGYHRLVIRYWKEHQTVVEGHAASCSHTARALISAGHKKQALKLLAGWRTWAGAAMWMVANYITCLSALRREDLQEIISAAEDALAGLPHDNCARYLAHARAEAHALLGDTEGLLDAWNKYQGYFDGKPVKGEWFEKKRRGLLASIPMMVRYLQGNQQRLYRKMVRSLRWNHLFPSL